MPRLAFFLIFVIAGFVSMPFFSGGAFISKAHAVDAPTVSEREHASAPAESKESPKPRCEYGEDPVTGKCYYPKEGQFYRDPKTGKLKKKKVTKYNWPWK